MHYFVVFFPIFSALTNHLQSAEVNGTSNIWPIGPRARLEIRPQFVNGMGHKLILKKNNESLNLTCTAVHQNGERNDTLFDYTVDWRIPLHADDNPRIERGQSKNMAWLWFDKLTEKDGGNYTCNAITLKSVGQPLISIKIYLSVKSKPTYCGSQWFRCRSTHCIMERYVCDGKEDCEEGEDESPEAGCESDPCKGKVFCNDRCIPPEWCCDHRNCSTTFGLRPWPPETHEISYVQTAFYTVIGCAMAFMFIVTILVIAICRVQIKRAMSSRWAQQNRDICRRPGRPVPLGMPMYDVDVYLNRSADNYPRGVSIMYNINSGVQFVGRPVEPPPYSEVIAAPPREGPPPPYMSCENLIAQTSAARITAENINLRQSASPPIVTGNHDILRSHELSDTSDTGQNVPGPQVPSGSLASASATMSSHNNADDSSCTSLNRVQNFDIEFVETDALLSQNPHNPKIRISKDPIWKSYTRHAIMKNTWLVQDCGDQATDKRRSSDKSDKSAQSSPLRSKVFSFGDCENEGVFLETDQPQSSSNSSSFSSQNVDSMHSSLSKSTFDNLKAGPSSSNAGNDSGSISIDETIKQSNDNTAIKATEFEVAGMSLNGECVCPHNSFSARPSQSQIRFVQSSNRRTFHDSESFKQPNESSTIPSATIVSTEDVQAISPETRNQVQDSQSLILPLRESFIGVQKDS